MGLFASISVFKQLIKQIAGNSEELVWAQVFHDACNGCEWLMPETLSLSPGRWAVGYNYLYPLFRILDEFRPKNILELGLGQSSKVIARYAESKIAGSGCSYTIIEHDKQWSDFFQQRTPLPPCASIKNIALETHVFDDGKTSCLVYQYEEKEFSSLIKTGGRYDLISIDAPFGSDTLSPYVYSRIDIITHIPSCLAKHFVVIIDDYNRKGEKYTADLIMRKLKEYGIRYFSGEYWGIKGTIVIVSEDLRFLCSL